MLCCRDLPNPEIKPKSPTLQADFLPSEPPGSGWPIPFPGYLPNQESNWGLFALQVDSLPAELPGKPILKAPVMLQRN